MFVPGLCACNLYWFVFFGGSGMICEDVASPIARNRGIRANSRDFVGNRAKSWNSREFARFRPKPCGRIVALQAIHVDSRVQHGSVPTSKPIAPPDFPKDMDMNTRFECVWPTVLKDYSIRETGVAYPKWTGDFAGFNLQKEWEVLSTYLIRLV